MAKKDVPNTEISILEKVEKELKKPQILMSVDESVLEGIEKSENTYPGLMKDLAQELETFNQSRFEFQRKAFTIDPTKVGTFQGIYIRRDGLLPVYVYKLLADNDPLVSTILNVRSSQASRLGYPQINRHDVGYKIAFRSDDVEKGLSSSEKQLLEERMKSVRDKFYDCGDNAGLPLHERLNLPQYLKEITRYALMYGLTATEIVRDQLGQFKGFRPLDSGTVFKAVTSEQDSPALKQLRREAIKSLHEMSGGLRINTDKFIDADDFINRRFSWIQVINTVPRSAFTDEELIVKYFGPFSDIENNGYPKPPMDQATKDIASHIHIITHNHLYFANGRASKGFLKIQGPNVQEHVIQRIRQQFNASINSVSNSFRMPVFGLPDDTDVTWAPFDSAGKDMEFQYLSDNTARAIMGVFSITPDEIPGYAHLARPTVNQALSDTNNSYQLQVGRTAGLVPLIMQIEAGLNDILKQMDPLVHQYCVFKFVGLESEDPQKESSRLQMESNLHLTANEMMRTVGKNPLPVGGHFLLNPQYNNLLKQQIPQNIINYVFTGERSFLTDPTLFYVADGFYFQYISMFKELLKSRGRVQQALKENLDELKMIVLQGKLKER